MALFEARVKALEEKAKEVRFHIIDMIHTAQSGHPGGSLSSADIMTALYFDILSVDPKQPQAPERDRFVLSKGHACPVWYACLALRGFFPVEELSTLRKVNSRLQGHPVAGKVPGIDATTGSLGIGFGQAVGMALEAKMTEKKYRVYALLGDGELDEGIIWESLHIANKFHLDNLTVIVDCNGLQNDGCGSDIMPMESLEEKFKSLNCEVRRINGHQMREILAVFDRSRAGFSRPLIILADTVKGKGVSFMENVWGWHGKAPNDTEYQQAIQDIQGAE
jgi:transketolase